MESLRESILERAKHKREKDRRVNDKVMQSKERKNNSSKTLDVGLVVMESNETESKRHVLSSRSRNDTHTDDADINYMNDKQPMAEVELSAEYNILANEQQHSEQSGSVYDTYLLEKVDRNTTYKSTDMSHRGGEIDQNDDAKKCSNSRKGFCECSIKNKLRKLKGNSVDTKYAKPSILEKPVLQPPRNQSVVRQPNAFKSKRPNFSKPRFASQVDVNNVLSKLVTPHYFSKVREFALAKSHHVNAPRSSRNSKKESMTCQKCVINANHDACITKFLKKVNSRAKIQPNKTKNNNKPIDPMSHTQKPSRKIVTGHSFSPNKSSAAHEKTNTPRSCLRWIPTGKNFNIVGLKWVPTGKTYTSSTIKVDCEPPNGSNGYITNPYNAIKLSMSV
nr:hypothetical protein [Tanacetum cinerariifolium]